MSDELRNRILNLLDANKIVCLSTIDGDRPRSRYLAVGVNEDLSLVSATFASSRKVSQINTNSNVCVLVGYSQANENNPWLVIDARAEVLTDDKTRKECWMDTLKVYFSGPEDDNYAVLKMIPSRIEYWTMGSMEPEVLEL